MARFEIRVEEPRCAGCLMCQLACSQNYTGAFNPSAARIGVEVRGVDCRITFTEECNQCGVCADHCFYGALEKAPGEAGK